MEELDAVKVATRCPHCGAKIAPDDVVCPKCGADI
ncbi:zinc-ribbon domain-containing protein [Candidatus Woesearchaeota archaeon]|nr:zinc-ribbon domain-containing protein [Candidatus Woesearchaeota archaeon]